MIFLVLLSVSFDCIAFFLFAFVLEDPCVHADEAENPSNLLGDEPAVGSRSEVAPQFPLRRETDRHAFFEKGFEGTNDT